MKVIVIDTQTGEQFNAYVDPEGLWIDDVSNPGYAEEGRYEII